MRPLSVRRPPASRVALGRVAPSRRTPIVARPPRYRSSRYSGRPAWYSLRGHDPAAVAAAVAAVLLIGTRQSFTVPFTGLGLSPAQLILLVLVLLWFATRVVGERSRATLGVLSLLLAVRLALLLVSYSRAVGDVLDPDQRTALDRTIVTEFAAAGTVLMLACVLRTTRDVLLVVRGLVVGGAIDGLFAVLQYLTGVDLGSKLRLPGLHDSGPSAAEALMRLGVVRSQGSSGAPLELGAVMCVLLPLGLGVLFLAHRRGRRRWPWALACLLMAGGAIVSVSRTVFVAGIVALLVMALRWPARRSAGVVLALLVAVGAALASGLSLVTTVTTVLRSGSDDGSLASRSNGRHYVWTHFALHFWFGQGPGTYDLAKQPVLDDQYLGQLMETGVLGLLAFAAVLLCALAYALRATARGVDPERRELAIAVAGALAAALVVQSVLDTAGFVQIYSLAWLLVALAAALWRVGVADVSVGRPPSVAAQRVPASRVPGRRSGASAR